MSIEIILFFITNIVMFLLISILVEVKLHNKINQFNYNTTEFLNKHIADKHLPANEVYPDLEITEEELPSEYDLLREKREEDFDKRIREIKEELALANSVEYKEGTTIADINDPNVYNLPHEEVNYYGGISTIPDEVSE